MTFATSGSTVSPSLSYTISYHNTDRPNKHLDIHSSLSTPAKKGAGEEYLERFWTLQSGAEV